MQDYIGKWNKDQRQIQCNGEKWARSRMAFQFRYEVWVWVQKPLNHENMIRFESTQKWHKTCTKDKTRNNIQRNYISMLKNYSKSQFISINHGKWFSTNSSHNSVWSNILLFLSLKYLLIHLSVSNQILLSFAAAANYNTHRTHLCAISSVIIHFPYNINNALFECFHFRLNVENWCWP